MFLDCLGRSVFPHKYSVPKKENPFLSLLFSVSCYCFGHAKNLGASFLEGHQQRYKSMVAT